MSPCRCETSESAWTSSSSAEEEEEQPHKRVHATPRARPGARAHHRNSHHHHSRPEQPDLAAALQARLASTGVLDSLRAQVRAAAVSALSGGMVVVAGQPPQPPAHTQLAFTHPHAPPSRLADALVAHHLACTGRSLSAGVFESEAGTAAPAAPAAALAAAVGLAGGAFDGGSVLAALVSAVSSGRQVAPSRQPKPAAPSARAALAAVRRELSGGVEVGAGAGGGVSRAACQAPPPQVVAEYAAATDKDARPLSERSSSSLGGECTLSSSSEG